VDTANIPIKFKGSDLNIPLIQNSQLVLHRTKLKATGASRQAPPVDHIPSEIISPSIIAGLTEQDVHPVTAEPAYASQRRKLLEDRKMMFGQWETDTSTCSR